MSLAVPGFATLVDDTVATVWIAPSRLIVAPRALVARFGRSCSFCGRRAPEARTLAAALDQDTRICGDCIALCLEMLGGDARPLPPSSPTRWDGVCAFLRGLPVETEADFDEWVVSLDAPSTVALPREACGFCGAHDEHVAKLINGPGVRICDGCVAGSVTLLRDFHDYCLRAPRP